MAPATEDPKDAATEEAAPTVQPYPDTYTDPFMDPFLEPQEEPSVEEQTDDFFRSFEDEEPETDVLLDESENGDALLDDAPLDNALPDDAFLDDALDAQGDGALEAQGDDAVPADLFETDRLSERTSEPGFDPEEEELAPGMPVPDAFGVSRIAVIRGLDKITARVRDVEAPVGVPVMFENFEILVQTCRRRPPEETPETTAFVQITEHRQDGDLEPVFSGWMFASSPSLNPVEHPVYDVWLIDCRTL